MINHLTPPGYKCANHLSIWVLMDNYGYHSGCTATQKATNPATCVSGFATLQCLTHSFQIVYGWTVLVGIEERTPVHHPILYAYCPKFDTGKQMKC